MTGNKLYEANHLCMMKLALIKEKNYKKTTTSKYHSSIVKTTYHIKNAEFQISPLDGAQFAKISSNLQQTTRENNAKYDSKMENIPHAYNQRKRNSNQSNQSHYYSHFYLKAKQTHADYAIRAAKRTGNALGNFFEAIIPT
jgi:hypothetical protein